MRYVDAHCHLDQYPRPQAEAEACEDTRTYTITVTNLPWEFSRTRGYVVGRRFVRAGVGLHPELVTQFPHAGRELLPLLREAKYVGEIGLDYTRATADERQLQRQVFASVVEECERLGGRVLTIHSRRAAKDVVEILRCVKRSRVFLHWYSGTMRILEQATAIGCFFSANPAMVRSASGREVVRAIPGDRIVTESDGPYVTLHGEVLRPSQMRAAMMEIAAIRGEDPEAFSARVLHNFRQAVSLEC